jgi:Cephalosporin hydroxylase
MKIEDLYNLNKEKPSDINEHLETLYKYAKECEIIAEFGIRWVCSSYALAHARPKKLICVDINRHKNIDQFIQLCKNENINAEFHQADTRTYELIEVDMLLIDTLHTFEQLTKELELHPSKVKKYMIFHDTISFGHVDENSHKTGENHGLVPAIRNFLKNNPQWKELETHINNNGLTILKRS